MLEYFVRLCFLWPWFILGGIGFLISRRSQFTLRPHLQNIVVVAFSFFFSLSLGELFLRAWGVNVSYAESAQSSFSRLFFSRYVSPFAHSDHGWFHVFEANDQDLRDDKIEFQYASSTNSLGLVDKEWPLQKKKKCRVAFLGDSYTQGVGAPVDSTFPKQLEYLTHDSVETLNCGVSGSDPFFEYILLEKKILKTYKPDRIYVAINSSDIFDVMTRGGFERFTEDGELHYKNTPWWEQLYAQMFLFRLFADKCLKVDFSLMSAAQRKQEQENAILELESCLDTFQKLCANNNVKLYFVFHPRADEVSSRSLVTSSILSYARNKNYNVVNVLDAFIQKGVNGSNVKEYFWPLDGHNNSRGYRVIAESLLTTF
jgi:hypothetical protein